MTTTLSRTVVTLSNGKRVANFSSPHPFEFEDGTVLPAVSHEDSLLLAVTFKEEVVNASGDIRLSFSLNAFLIEAIEYWYQEWQNGRVDVVFCPLPMIRALYEWQPDDSGFVYDVEYSPFRAIRMVDRIQKKVSIHKQCL